MNRALIKFKKYVVLVSLLSSTFHSTIVNANEIKNQNLSNPSGTTIHSNWHTVLLNSGGPYTINNAGTVTVTQSSGINAQVETAEEGYMHIRRQAQALLLIVV